MASSAGGEGGEGWGSMSADERANRLDMEQNTAFGQVSAVMNQMLEFGAVSHQGAVDFIVKMRTLQACQNTCLRHSGTPVSHHFLLQNRELQLHTSRRAQPGLLDIRR